MTGNKEIMIRVLLLLNGGKLKAEYIHFNEEHFSSTITVKTRDYLDNKYQNYKILGIYVFELIAELKELL